MAAGHRSPRCLAALLASKQEVEKQYRDGSNKAVVVQVLKMVQPEGLTVAGARPCMRGCQGAVQGDARVRAQTRQPGDWGVAPPSPLTQVLSRPCPLASTLTFAGIIGKAKELGLRDFEEKNKSSIMQASQD